MLVNLSPRPRESAKDERLVRLVLRRWHYDKGFAALAKRFAGFKRFEPYKPCGDEFVKDSAPNFNGCWTYNNLCGLLNFEYEITQFCKQHALDSADYGFKSVEYWDHYGLCDNATQVIEFYNKRKAEGLYPGNHVIILQPKYGGFRWHKWGQYIGEFDHKCEYFDDEKGIKMVYSFTIVRIK